MCMLHNVRVYRKGDFDHGDRAHTVFNAALYTVSQK